MRELQAAWAAQGWGTAHETDAAERAGAPGGCSSKHSLQSAVKSILASVAFSSGVCRISMGSMAGMPAAIGASLGPRVTASAVGVVAEHRPQVFSQNFPSTCSSAGVNAGGGGQLSG